MPLLTTGESHCFVQFVCKYGNISPSVPMVFIHFILQSYIIHSFLAYPIILTNKRGGLIKLIYSFRAPSIHLAAN